MNIYLIENIGGKNYYFKKKHEMRNFFIFDGDILFDVLERYKIIEMNEEEYAGLSNKRDNLIFGVNLTSELNLRQLHNFNMLRKSVNFNNLLIEFIDSTGLKEVNITEDAIFALKKKLLVKSKSLPNLLRALEVDDSILKYFLIKNIKKYS
jgi:regulatory protein YycH of two-component signal transduction system YycFG